MRIRKIAQGNKYMEGYIKLWRSLLEKPIWFLSTPEQKTVLITLLLMANHYENSWDWHGKTFKVQKGEFVTSLESIRKSAGKGISIQNIRGSIIRFKKLGFLTEKPTKHGRIIKIVNWSSYQPSEKLPNIKPNKDPTKPQHLRENDKNVRIKPIKKKPEWLNLKSWEEYTKHRKEMKAPLTQLAETKALKKLKSLMDGGYSQVEVIDQSIESGWKGLFPVKNKNKGRVQPKEYKLDIPEGVMTAEEMQNNIKRLKQQTGGIGGKI